MTNRERFAEACRIYREGNASYAPIVRMAGAKIGYPEADVDALLEAYRLLYGVTSPEQLARTHPWLVS